MGFEFNYTSDRSIACFKTKLVAQGYFKILNINFVETFGLTIRRESYCINLVFCIIFGLIIYLVNIINIYLQSLLNNNNFSIYIKPLSRIKNMKKIL